MATAWAAQLRVSEYTSRLIADIQAGNKDHNLCHNGVLILEDGITVIFASDKSSHKCKERFITWDSIPIDNFKELLQEYNKIRIKTSPVYFCHKDGTNLTPNDMSNWIDLSIMITDRKGLKITSHCGSTSYLYRSGLDIPSLQRSRRWAQSDASTVEHYLKPGLYSVSPETIHKTPPQYKSSMTLIRAMYLRDCVMTPGGTQHPFNKILVDLEFTKLQHPEYPTARAKRIQQQRKIVALANDYLKEVKLQHSHKMLERTARIHTSTKMKAQFRIWRQTQHTSNLRTLTSHCMNDVCNSCHAIQKHTRVSHTKIQSLSHEIVNEEAFTTQLQEAKSQIGILTAQNERLQEQVQKQQTVIHQQSTTIQSLEQSMQQISKENDMLLQMAGKNGSLEKMHKQTRTVLPGEDWAEEGSIMYPSSDIVNAIKEKQKIQFTQKYVDPMGEASLIPIIKLKTNMHKCN